MKRRRTMMKKLPMYLSVLLVTAVFVSLAPLTYADYVSSTTTSTGSNNSGTNDAGATIGVSNEMNTPTAIDGYCAVCLMNGKKVKGSDEHSALYKGKKYMFDSAEDRKTFIEDPEKYTQDLDSKYSRMKA
jgi:YHS domain-containing protein